MSRKDYIATAKIVAGSPVARERRRLAEEFADMFEADSPHFDRDRFMVACGVG
jgi:hypothetical protein